MHQLLLPSTLRHLQDTLTPSCQKPRSPVHLCLISHIGARARKVQHSSGEEYFLAALFLTTKGERVDFVAEKNKETGLMVEDRRQQQQQQ